MKERLALRKRLVTFASFGHKTRSDLAFNAMMINSSCALKLWPRRVEVSVSGHSEVILALS